MHTLIKNLLNGQSVEWKALGEVVNVITAPTKVKKDKYSPSGSIPIIDQGEEFISGYTDENLKAVDDGEYVIFGDHSEHIKYVDFPFIQGADGLKILKPINLFPKYVYYAFTNFYKKEGNYKRHWANARNTLIPIPPLEIQEKIVKILDKLTKLTAELTAEHALRQKQYQYYRDKLLNFSDNVEWKSLGEVGELIRGNGLQKKDFTETGVPAIHYGQIYTRYGLSTETTISFVSPELAKKLRKVNTGDVVITNTSENLADVGKALVYLGKEQAVTGGHATIFKPNKQIILGKYFAYFTQTDNFATQKRKYAKGTKVIDVSATDMAKIKIPIPPLEIQAQIVAILDKFDTLTHSISEGLPREIELRQKQYEYYRELLLDFNMES